MSSIIIKGMEMPKTCIDCDWSKYVGNGRAMCRRVSKTDKADVMTKRRADFCPLIEIPTPHGDLVDRTELLAEYDRQHNGPAGGARRIMEQATAVIEAEE